MKNISIRYDSDISKDNTEIRIAFYANIGFFIEVAQMFEFNLRKLLCYELSVKEIEEKELTTENVSRICSKYDQYYDDTYSNRWTLGKLKDEVKRLSSLTDDICDIIQEINDYRVMIVHKIFQNNVISGNLSSAKTVQDYTNTRLIPMINKAVEINRLIIKIIDLYREDLHSYKKQVGIYVDES